MLSKLENTGNSAHAGWVSADLRHRITSISQLTSRSSPARSGWNTRGGGLGDSTYSRQARGLKRDSTSSLALRRRDLLVAGPAQRSKHLPLARQHLRHRGRVVELELPLLPAEGALSSLRRENLLLLGEGRLLSLPSNEV